MANVETRLTADVVVIGGGPAATWAAISAARRGATVVLADKGYCGTSGAAAPSGNGVLYVEPVAVLRAQAVQERLAIAGGLARETWIQRVMERTWHCIQQVEQWGYAFPADSAGNKRKSSLQGPDYLRLMRRQVLLAGVKILDQSPALELIRDDNGIAGVAGTHRQRGTGWQVSAPAVVIASGGCAFLSHSLGTNVLTGDGYLLAGEAGAELSGMEFSTAYGIAVENSSITKSFHYKYATFYRENGEVLDEADFAAGRVNIARALGSGRVFATINKIEPWMKQAMRDAQPNFFLVFDRLKIDPFSDRFPVTLLAEGTVRGTGGIRLIDRHCATRVSGMFAAGDAASRELFCGSVSGGGAHNAAWAMSSGCWAGEGAAAYALRRPPLPTSRPASGLSGISEIHAGPLRGASGRARYGCREILEKIQAEMLPYDRNLFKNACKLTASLQQLDELWQDLKRGGGRDEPAYLSHRELAAMVMTARWMYLSALNRPENLGMHWREDAQAAPAAARSYFVTVRGVDRVIVRKKPTDSVKI